MSSSALELGGTGSGVLAGQCPRCGRCLLRRAMEWKRHQDAVIELLEHNLVLIVEETGCLQAKVCLQRRSVDSLDACIYAEIMTLIPETISWDCEFEHAGSTLLTFTVKLYSYKSTALKIAIDDLEWPGSSIQIILHPAPLSLTFKEKAMETCRPPASHPDIESVVYQQPTRIAYMEFFVKPEVDEDEANDSKDFIEDICV